MKTTNTATNKLFENGILIHASAVRTPAGAMLFMGPSGAGKSTICNLLASHYEIIHDDVIHIFRNKEKGWLVDASPRYMAWFSGARLRGKHMPLSSTGCSIMSIMHIKKASHPYCTAISQRELCLQLTNGIIEVAGQSRSYNTFLALNWFKAAAEISRNNSGYNLQFTKTHDTVNYLLKLSRI